MKTKKFKKTKLKIAVDHSTRKHALLSASGADRWINCPGSVVVEQKYVESSSAYAAEGTLAHELADICLAGEKDADEFVGVEILANGVMNIITADMSRFVQQYLDYVRAFVVDTKCQLMTEERVDFSNVVPDGFGTLDASVIDYNKRVCHIFDLKYGQGIAVSAVENNQGKMYAIGLFNELRWLDAFDTFVIHIVQPRKSNFSCWTISVVELLEFAKFVKERATLAMSGKGARVPGDKQCQWCKHKANCVELAQFTESTIGALFDDLDELDDVENLTQQKKSVILGSKKVIELFLKAVETDVFQTLDDGGTFPGFKLVEGRSTRKFIDGVEAMLVETYGDEVINKKLKGLTDIQKIIGADKMDELTYKPPGRPTLAPDTDKRRAIVNVAVVDEFEDLDL